MHRAPAQIAGDHRLETPALPYMYNHVYNVYMYVHSIYMYMFNMYMTNRRAEKQSSLANIFVKIVFFLFSHSIGINTINC